MIEKLKTVLFYKVPPAVNQKEVLPQIMEDNRKFAIIWSSAQMLYWVYCLIMASKRSDFFECRYLYLTAFIICAASIALAVTAVPKFPWLIRPVAIAVDMALLGAGVGIARNLAPKTIIIFASVLIIPVFFICDMLSTILILLFNIIMFAVTGAQVMQREVFGWTLTNMIIFSSVGCVLGYFVNKTRFERYFYAQAAVQLAQSNIKIAQLQTKYAYYDQMTDLKNRRAYAEKTHQMLSDMPKGICVIMADINGLKKTNDTLGHDAGDELVIGAAKCIKESFDNTDLIYRVGGDEFCIIMNGTEADAKIRIQNTKQKGNEWKGEYIDHISISFGAVDDAHDNNIKSMLQKADQKMYASKRSHYKSKNRHKN